MNRYDCALVGGGLLGLATAHHLLRRRPGLRLAVLEKEPALALHQSGRNSGVVHAGIYYRPGSLKARLCLEGRGLLARFAEEHGVPYEVRGQLIVATEESELRALRELADRARGLGVEVEEAGPERIRDLEPHVRGIAGLHAPTTAVTDFRAIALALAEEIRSRGGTILLEHGVTSIRSDGRRRVLGTPRGTVAARFVMTCAGLQSDRVAALAGGSRDPRILPFRGAYHRLESDAAALVRGLVYPVPDIRLPFLGVHFTRRVNGEVWVGPGAVLALAREGSRPWRVSPRDLAATLGFGGFWRLAGRHWRAGLEEVRRDLSRSALLRACRRYIPDLEPGHLVPGPFGVRAQAVHEDGSLEDDFSMSEGDRALHLRNAPSPGATACLAIGRVLAEQALTALDAR